MIYAIATLAGCLVVIGWLSRVIYHAPYDGDQLDAMARYRRERLECERRREQARAAVESGQVYQWN